MVTGSLGGGGERKIYDHLGNCQTLSELCPTIKFESEFCLGSGEIFWVVLRCDEQMSSRHDQFSIPNDKANCPYLSSGDCVFWQNDSTGNSKRNNDSRYILTVFLKFCVSSCCFWALGEFSEKNPTMDRSQLRSNQVTIAFKDLFRSNLAKCGIREV